MTKEQAIEKIKWSININELTKDIIGSNTSINVEVLKTVLSMLEEKNKQIDLMSEQLTGLAIFNIDKEETLILSDKEEVKQYFENKAKELINK